MAVIVGTVWKVVTAVATAVGIIGGTIASVVGTLAYTIAGMIGAILSTIGGAFDITLTNIKYALANTVGTIINGVSDAIRLIQMEIDYHALTTFKPVVDTLVTVQDFMKGVYKWTETALTPLKGVIDVVNTISAVAIVKYLIEGEIALSDAIKAVYKHAGESTAFALLQMYNTIVETSLKTVEMVHENYKAIAEIVDNSEERLALEIKQVEDYVTTKIATTEFELNRIVLDRLDPIELTLQRLELERKDIPLFRVNLLKALE